MLDDHQRVAVLAQPLQHLDELCHVVKVQAGGGLIKNVEGAAGVAFGEFFGQLDALRLAAGKRGRVLAEGDVAEPHVHEGGELAVQCGHGFEELGGFFHRHAQHLVHGLAAVVNLQRFSVVAAALAGVAGDVDVGQKVHLDLDHAIALTGFAASATHVEAEAARRVAAGAALGHRREQVADGAEQPGVGGGVGAWGAADGRLVDVDDLVEQIEPVDAIAGCGEGAGAIQVTRRLGVERVVDQRGFARAGDAGDAGHEADGNLGIDILEVVAAGVADANLLFGVPPGARAGHLDHLPARQVGAGDGIGVAGHVIRRALGNDLAAVDARAGADVDHMIGMANGVFIVLDHDHGVAEVAQVEQRFEQPRIVALMQADAGFIEHIHDANQAGADLAGQTNALRFAARQGFGAARQGEVVEPDIVEKAKALADLFQDLVGNLALVAGQGQLREKGFGIAHRQGGQGRQVALGHEHVAGGAVQALAIAFRAGLFREITRQFLAHRVGVGLFVAAFEVGNDAFELVRGDAQLAALVRIFKRQFFAAAAIQHDLLMGLAEGTEGLLHIDAVVLGQRLDEVPVIRVAPVPAADGAVGQRQLGMGNDALGVEHLHLAEAVAALAGAGRGVEREQPWLQFVQGVAAVRAAHARREGDGLALAIVRDHAGQPVRQAQGGFKALGEALLEVIAHLEAVDHHVDVVLLLAVQHRHVVQFIHRAVDPHAHEALRTRLLEPFGMFALAVTHHGGQQQPG